MQAPSSTWCAHSNSVLQRGGTSSIPLCNGVENNLLRCATESKNNNSVAQRSVQSRPKVCLQIRPTLAEIWPSLGKLGNIWTHSALLDQTSAKFGRVWPSAQATVVPTWLEFGQARSMLAQSRTNLARAAAKICAGLAEGVKTPTKLAQTRPYLGPDSAEVGQTQPTFWQRLGL